MCKFYTYLFLGFFAAWTSGCVDSERPTENLTLTVQDLPLPEGVSESTVMTVSGRLVDTKCYGMNHANIEADHDVVESGEVVKVSACARACAAMSIPVGVLMDGERSGEVLVVLAPSKLLADHMSKRARVTGRAVFDGGVLPDKIEVMNPEGVWEEIKIDAMM